MRGPYAANKLRRMREGFRQVDHGLLPKLAERYGVSVPGIKAAISGRHWPHVPMPIASDFFAPASSGHPKL
ncbi:hypothetical protein [Rhizobium johnstonii]|uniref:hypothetical protein n=1 Tax=Rhizobium johnstonii TaxID=3019933 RepID=UPI003F9AE502